MPLVLKSCTWNMGRDEKKIYLSFDDGPVEGVTPWLLDLLKKHEVKATFFCIGKNIRANRGIYERILTEGHAVGNHTHDHMNGWKTKTEDYLQNVDQCAEVCNSNLFRPPYGKIKLPQLRKLSRIYRIVMWDVLSYDWVQSLSPNDVLQNTTKHATNGSIVVFHDSIKAEKNLKGALEPFIIWCKESGFSFDTIDQ